MINSNKALGRLLRVALRIPFKFHSRKDIKKNPANKVLEGLLGLAVGDALGVPFEFYSRRDMKKSPAEDMEGFLSHSQSPGTWSDDSSLTFCLAESLCTGLDLTDIAQKFCDWYERGYWTGRGIVFDIGCTTRIALKNIEKGMKPELSGKNDENSNGNGSLMRILPLAYFLENYEGDKFEIIHNVSAITHRHIRSQIACSIYIEFTINLLKGLSPINAYEEMQQAILRYYTDKVSHEELNHFDRILKRKIYKLRERHIKSDGYVIHTLEASLWSFINSKNYKTAVLTAINLGEDTDTTGAVTGGVAGIYYGLESIPDEWVNQIARREDIIALSNKLYNKINY